MKVGILTLDGTYNYGNRLQNLAVTKLLQDRGFEVETIVCQKINWRILLRRAYNSFFFWKPKKKRDKSFSKFNKKYLKIRYIYNQTGIIPQRVNNDYDLFVVGSDQVWNPEVRKQQRPNFFLQFADSNKRICIAPSIGVSTIEKEYEETFRQGLLGFNHLCCREEQGAAEITRLTNRHCEVLIDPTLAIPADYWRKIANYNNTPKNKYILCIFLGPITTELYQSIYNYANASNMEVINLISPDCPFYTSDPSYFISLIDKAELVLTDSFHAIIFSINLNTNFFAFDRKMSNKNSIINSRIYTILKKLSLENRYIHSNNSFESSSINYNIVNHLLNKERSKFNSFIDKSLFSTDKYEE